MKTYALLEIRTPNRGLTYEVRARGVKRALYWSTGEGSKDDAIEYACKRARTVVVYSPNLSIERTIAGRVA